MSRNLYQDEYGGVFYYSDEVESDDAEEVIYYYYDEAGEDNEAEEIVYYYADEENEPQEQLDSVTYYYYEDEAPAVETVNHQYLVSPGVINTKPDSNGTSWDAASYERDKEIERIANEGEMTYADAFKTFGKMYESYDPDLSGHLS